MTDQKIAVAQHIVAEINATLPKEYSVSATHKYHYFSLSKQLRPPTKGMPAFVSVVGHRLSFHELVLIWIGPLEELAKRLSSLNEAEKFLVNHRLSKGE